MQYRHRFVVKAPQSFVAAFHRQADSMGAITPPPVRVRIHSAPAELRDGDQMDFTLWLGPLPIHWLARIEQATPVSFVDRQISGPFAAWEHLHLYVMEDSTTTVVVDQVTAELSRHWFWRLIGLGMWGSLPILFAYRGWKTQRILEAQAANLAVLNV
jgi:ligand-binding SRPBCC domain-containing protein